MANAALALSEPAAPRSKRAWPERTVEFLLTGGATLVLFPLGWLLRGLLGLDDAELAVSFAAFYGAHLINDPHFAVTYLLFYDRVRARVFGGEFSALQRVRYVLAGFVVPLLLAAWGVAAVARGSAPLLGWMIQLMFLLVGWHYVKQGFGVLTVISARRGVSFTAFERRALLAHCYAGWAFAWASPYDPGQELEEKGVVYKTLAHPHYLFHVTLAIFLLSTLVGLVALVVKWRRERRLPPLAALVGLLMSVWLWTVFSSIDPLMLYVIPGLHSVQYLYFVWLLRRNQARAHEGPPDFGRPAAIRLGWLAAGALALGFVLFHGAPELLDTAVPHVAESNLGATPCFAALFAFVNIHHYFMDTVIWRRENPDTRYLRG